MEMAQRGFIHIGEELKQTGLTPEEELERLRIITNYEGVGYSIELKPAYEPDGNTIKKGYSRLYFN